MRHQIIIQTSSVQKKNKIKLSGKNFDCFGIRLIPPGIVIIYFIINAFATIAGFYLWFPAKTNNTISKYEYYQDK
jgi:hypothetical protein